MLLVVETKFRKLNALGLLQDVWEGPNSETQFEPTIIRNGTPACLRTQELADAAAGRHRTY